ncbi:winged helix-turn-helix domain-containing protein [Haloarcula nitratireducens]|uniref:Helix-turn-helix domain-containing protein n=1 Tax=Haloarcula nitratireducens TaxID=2487749 RepID=A0AAW4PET8_9EURY|nr:helix-turn-helix domain-containing protein [Halomicroarcula nitratireducens]MBX0296103.1 helix-turn-helix domain-containing protein [Halomicroarcula nitratireducens]
MSRDWEPETIFEVLGSEDVRRILAVANVDPVSVPALAEVLDASEPTVYRRVNVCQEYDLLREDTRVDGDGNHYKVYETTLERVCFELDGGGFEVDLELRRETVDQVEDVPRDDFSAGEDA